MEIVTFSRNVFVTSGWRRGKEGRGEGQGRRLVGGRWRGGVEEVTRGEVERGGGGGGGGGKA